MLTSLIALTLLTFQPGEIEGTYQEYVKCEAAIVEVWGDQSAIVADIAQRLKFTVRSRNSNKSLIVFKGSSKDLKLRLMKLSEDAGVERIYSFSDSQRDSGP